MNSNPVINFTLIIRSQAEYSPSTQSVVMRCVLEQPATGERRGFTEIKALLDVLQAELMEIQSRIIPPEEGAEKF